MPIERRLVFLAASICVLPLISWLYVFWTPDFSRNLSDWNSFGGFFGGVLSPTLAFLSFLGLLATLRQQRASTERTANIQTSEKYFQHAVTSLERAFRTIAGGGEHIVPIRDRLAWLTCARLLLSARTLASRIHPDATAIQAMYEGEEEYWRMQFFEFLKPTSSSSFAASPEYFEREGSSTNEVIDERAIRTVYEFMKWPHDRQDPIDAVPLYTKSELEALPVGMRGIRCTILNKKRFRTTSAA